MMMTIMNMIVMIVKLIIDKKENNNDYDNQNTD